MEVCISEYGARTRNILSSMLMFRLYLPECASEPRIFLNASNPAHLFVP